MIKTSEKNDAKKIKRNSPLYLKMCKPMIVLVALQMISFFLVLTFSGEFSTIKKYAYDVLGEKTENRSGYIENVLNQKTALVYESSKDINDTVQKILYEDKKTISDIKRDKELNKKIIADSADALISLLRRDMVNDAFIILNTGSLYDDSENRKLTGLYIRDIDIKENDVSDNQDLFLEMGSSAIAKEKGINMDFEWSLYLDNTANNDYSYITRPIDAYEQYKGDVYNMGYWSGLSKISKSAEKSIKYTLPLVAEDGTAYGVIGIGILEKSIQQSIPSNDFLNDSACYILGADFDNNDIYERQIHSGAAYARLVDENTEFNKKSRSEYKLYEFNTTIPTVGCISDINLYKTKSPFKNQQWALISVADSNQILEIYHNLVRMLFISGAFSLVSSIIFALIMSRRITNPVSKMINTLESDTDTENVISFESSSIAEIDKLSEAITELQINVREQASRVSNILSMADADIGVFMYDCKLKNVFIGKSLIKIFDFKDISADRDITIPFSTFCQYLDTVDSEHKISGMSIFSDEYDKDEKLSASEEICWKKKNSAPCWFRFTLTRENNNVIGLVQEFTKMVLERQKIEHERDFDVTTNLYNRRAFYRIVDELFREPKKLGIAAFLMIDLDNLKFVNDTYGHDFGDDYIRTAADVLRTMEIENAIVSRQSGDEFLVFIYGAESKEQIRALINDTRQKMKNSYCILSDGTHYKIRASGGYAWYPDDSDSYDALIKYADFAMYTIKHSTKGNIAEFNEHTYMNDSILITGIEEMNRIIDNGDIKYAFQPIIDAHTGRVYGYEALMRPQSKIITSIVEFIRIAKSSAKLYEIERLTWFLGLESFKQLLVQGKISKDSKLFINSISNCILSDVSIEALEKKFSDIIGNIVLEILESEQTNTEYAEKKKSIIAKWNALVALDDFGTGYNSEYALITMNPDIIKIDRSIISGCNNDISKLTIITNLVKIAKSKNVKILAEGIESYDEMKTVMECGVDFMQGYYFAKPSIEPIKVKEKIIEQIKDINGEMQ